MIDNRLRLTGWLHDEGRSCWLLVRQASLQVLDEGLHFLVSCCGVILQLLVATKQPWVAPVVIASFQAGSTDPEVAEGCILRCILREEHFCIISGCRNEWVWCHFIPCVMGVAGARGAVSTIELMATGLIAAAILLVTMSPNWLKAG